MRRPFATERVVSRERRRRWVLRIAGPRRRAYDVQATLATLRRPFRPCSVRVNGRRLKRRRGGWTLREGVLRFTARGRRVRAEVRGCR